MNRDGWRKAGELARRRRERMGLDQNELQRYGGPGSSTVGKFERAVQENFPPRTQQQLERALGWPTGSIESIRRVVDAGEWTEDEEEDFVERLVHDNMPDLTRESRPAAGADESGLVTFRLQGNFGVDVTVQGPVGDLDKLESAVARLLDQMGDNSHS